MTASADVEVFRGDISDEYFSLVSQEVIVAVDIETAGLDWREHPIATCQVFAIGHPAAVVQIKPGMTPRLLSSLISHEGICKVFHHAMFDLRFIRHNWSVEAANVACTKIASKLCRPTADHSRHRLVHLTEEYLGVRIDKSQQQSEWLSDSLTDAQLEYAINDVKYLIPLLYSLLAELRERRIEQLALDCFAHLRTRVELDLMGLADIYQY